MITIEANTYSVYLHVFPDGKKYVGSTSLPVRARWDGGLGYEHQKKVFSAILKYGWENIKHYILFEHLDKETALLIEAALIRLWKTYWPSVGYNTMKPELDGLDEYVVPKFKKRLVKDVYNDQINQRYIRRREANKNTSNRKREPVRLVETGEIFESMKSAALYVYSNINALRLAVDNPNRTCGTVWIEDADEGWRMEVRAHWERVN